MKKPTNTSLKLVYYDPTFTGKNLSVVLPNMALFVREVIERGNIGAIIGRARQLSLFALIKLAWWNKGKLLKLAKKDFAAGVVILIQMELLQIARFSPRMVVLTDQIVDLAVALQKTSIITDFLQTARELQIPASLVTNNLVTTRMALSQLGLSKVVIITPFNSYGYEMNPSQTEVEAVMKLLDPAYIYAIVPTDTPKQTAYLHSFGIYQKVTGWF